MADDIAKAQDAEIQQQVEQPVEPMPSSEQTTEPEQEVVSSDTSESTLPETASERTKKEFERLREQLRVEREEKQKILDQQKQYGSSVLDSLRVPETVATQNFPSLNQEQVNTISQSFIDDEGNVDVHGLNKALGEANRRAEEAVKGMAKLAEKVSRMEDDQQTRDAHAAFPQLDPGNPSFDPTFFEFVRDRMVSNWYQGRNESLAQAASSIATRYNLKPAVEVQKVKEEAVAAYQKSLQKKEQATTIPTGTTGQTKQIDAQSQEDLRRRTRLGDDEALFKRLRALESPPS